MNIVGQDSDTDYRDIWVLNFGVGMEDDPDEPDLSPNWYELRVGGTLPEVRYGGHGGVYPLYCFSFWMGFGFNKKEETGKRLGDTLLMRFTNASTVFDAYQ